MRFSVLVSGTLTGFFSSSYSLRQGDPLSPLLVVVVMAALSRMISAIVSEGLLFDFSLGQGLISRIFCLWIILMIFCEDDPYHLRHMRCLFICFEVV
jgi:ABC-type phosphate/phosphonate transport system permease subunit